MKHFLCPKILLGPSLPYKPYLIGRNADQKTTHRMHPCLYVLGVWFAPYISKNCIFCVNKNKNLRSRDKITSVLSVPRARRYAYDKIRHLLFKYFMPELGIEQMSKVPSKIKISYLLVDILIERLLNIPKRP